MAVPFDPLVCLEKPLMAILATVCANGEPRSAPVWYIWEQEALWMLSHTEASSLSRIEANPECSVEICDYDNAEGRLLHLGLRGRAEIWPNDPALFRRLLKKYLGAQEHWNRWFIDEIARIEDEAGRMIRLKPASIFTNNVSYFRTGPERLRP